MKKLVYLNKESNCKMEISFEEMQFLLKENPKIKLNDLEKILTQNKMIVNSVREN